MALNTPDQYGIDIACISDADDLLSAVSGIALVVQDAIHAITQDSFLGPGGDGRGTDVRLLIGLTEDELAVEQGAIVETLLRDDRILTVDVVLTSTSTKGLSDVEVSVSGTTALGPFDFTKSVLELTSTIGDIES